MKNEQRIDLNVFKSEKSDESVCMRINMDMVVENNDNAAIELELDSTIVDWGNKSGSRSESSCG